MTGSELDLLGERGDQHGHHPSTVICADGTIARCAWPPLNAAMAVAAYHDHLSRLRDTKGAA